MRTDRSRKSPRASRCRFACVRFGHSADADRKAARVIAIKGHWHQALPRKSERPDGPLPDELRLETFVIDCAIRRSGA